MNRSKLIKTYVDMLKKDEVLLLKSKDPYFKCHYSGSSLNILTGFEGSSGEAVIDKNSNITIFVDPRYHILVEKQVFDDVKIVKIPLKESFIKAISKKYKKNTVLYIPSDISLSESVELSKHFKIKTYEDKSSNLDFNSKNPIYKARKEGKFKQNKKMLVFNLDDISYLTGMSSFQMKLSSNFKSIMYLDKTKSTLFADNIKNAKKLSEFKSFIKKIDDEIYVNYKDITLDNFLLIKNPKKIKTDKLKILSSIKTKESIDDMLYASKQTDFAIYDFKKKIKSGLSEYDLVKIFEEEMINKGAKSLSFKTILAIGQNSTSIHYSSYDKNKILKDENIILLDCGGYWESGLASDITRTFYFGKNPSKIQKTIYTAVLKAFINCFLSDECDAKKLDGIARKMLEPYKKQGFYFNHGLGHGIGTSVHQNPPLLSSLSKDIIRPYQTHSIEPGLYGDDFGVRIENCVYFDENYRRKSLSSFPFEEILIDYNMLNAVEKDYVRKWQANFDRN